MPVAWGLTEREHGSDLLAGEMTAVPVVGGYRVDGEKWLINNATRGDIVSLLVRTDPAAGPRGFSVLLFDKRTARTGTYRCLPKVPTHGIRGADISGISVRGQVPARALIGSEGSGIETVLTALQLTRTVCAALSLGAGDQAVGLAAEFTAGRLLYGRSLIELPHVRRTLGRACATLLAAEAVTTVAARAIQALPGEMSVVSAVTKSFVPARVDELITDCGELLGARAFLTDTYADGRFSKLERDHRVVGIFDGTTVVNQNLVINHAAALARGYRSGRADIAGLELAADLRLPLPAPDPGALRLVATAGCSVTQALPGVVREVRRAVDTGTAPAAVAEAAAELQRCCAQLHDELGALRPVARDVPAGAFALAERYEACFAGAAVLSLWLRNRSWAETGSSAPLWEDALWVRACLGLLLQRCGLVDDRTMVPNDSDLYRLRLGELFDRLADVGITGHAPVPLFPFDPVGAAPASAPVAGGVAR